SQAGRTANHRAAARSRTRSTAYRGSASVADLAVARGRRKPQQGTFQERRVQCTFAGGIPFAVLAGNLTRGADRACNADALHAVLVADSTLFFGPWTEFCNFV